MTQLKNSNKHVEKYSNLANDCKFQQEDSAFPGLYVPMLVHLLHI